jgi:O-antigen/teichoic acid export membrane protein
MSLHVRFRQVLMVGGVETFGVAVGGIAGLLIVNLLPKDQYAVYTFLMACLSLMTGISDLGLGQCVLPVVGQRANDSHWVMGVCRQIFRWRWILMALALAIVLPYWLNASTQHQWIAPAYLAATVVMLGVLPLTLQASFSHMALLVLGQVSALNRAALAMHSTRFLLVGAVLLAPFGEWQTSALFAATALSLVVDIRLQQRSLNALAMDEGELSGEERDQVKREALRIALPLVPSAIFFQVQSVITVLIVSVFGTTDMMAEVGALGRLAMILVVLDRVTNMLLFPAIARSPGGPTFVKRLLLVHGAYFGLMLLIFLTSVLWPQYWMLLLGRQYEAQQPYLWLAIGAYVLTSASGFAFRTLTGRGATARQWITIPLVLVVQVVFVAVAGVNTLPLVLAFNLVTSLTHFVYQYTLVLAQLPGWRKSA